MPTSVHMFAHFPNAMPRTSKISMSGSSTRCKTTALSIRVDCVRERHSVVKKKHISPILDDSTRTFLEKETDNLFSKSVKSLSTKYLLKRYVDITVYRTKSMTWKTGLGTIAFLRLPRTSSLYLYCRPAKLGVPRVRPRSSGAEIPISAKASIVSCQMMITIDHHVAAHCLRISFGMLSISIFQQEVAASGYDKIE